MNLVGHVAVAPDDAGPEFLAGCVLPDVAAIARVRLARPTDGLAAGVAFHHECDHVFHGSEWFLREHVQLRDDLLAAGVDRGPARAAAHAGLEMLLDGALVAEPMVHERFRAALDRLAVRADELAELAAPGDRDRWVAALRRIATDLDASAYADPASITLRLQRMTAGRTRIEVRADQAAAVTAVLATARPAVSAAAPAVVATVAACARSTRGC